jgi:hypothetical protein
VKEGAGGRGGGGKRCCKACVGVHHKPPGGVGSHLMSNYYGKWVVEAALTPKQAIKDDLGGWVLT